MYCSSNDPGDVGGYGMVMGYETFPQIVIHIDEGEGNIVDSDGWYGLGTLDLVVNERGLHL